MDNRRLVKTVRYANPRYIGDPINAVRIFNEKQVDELVLLDIGAQARGIAMDHLAKIVPEAFMPLAYGGGIRTLDEIRSIFRLGVEKVVLGTSAARDLDLLKEASRVFGSQSIVASLDLRRNWLGRKHAYYRNARRLASRDPLTFARALEAAGAGEILLNDVDREGTMAGMDLALFRSVAEAVSVPVVASGGAGSLDDLLAAWRQGGVHAVAAGSLFVYKGRLRAVLINYPSEESIQERLSQEP